MNEIQLGLLWASRRVCNRAKLKKNMGELLNDGNKLHDMLQEEGGGGKSKPEKGQSDDVIVLCCDLIKNRG